MIYTIRSRTGVLVAVLRSWDGEITHSHSATGHWTWCVGRKIESVLSWAKQHYFKWEVNPAGWEAAIEEIGKST